MSGRPVVLATIALCALAALLATGTTAARAASGPLVICPVGAECGVIPVPLDRADPSRGDLGLAVARVRGPAPRRGALLFLTGGPGEAGIARDDADFMRELRRIGGGRDVIAVDVRGTGRSGALRCPVLQPRGDEEAATGTGSPDADVRLCAEQIGERRARFATSDVVADLEKVRADMEIDSWSIAGVSYGTWYALAYARAHPARVERLLLDSPLPPAGPDARDLPSFAAARRILDGLCEDRRCPGVRDLPRQTRTLAARLRRAPVPGSAVDADGRARRGAVGGPSDQSALWSAFRAGDVSAAARLSFPTGVVAALRGDSAMLQRIVSGGGDEGIGHPTRLSAGAFLATACADLDVPWSAQDAPGARRAALRTGLLDAPAGAYAPFGPAASADLLAGVCLPWPEAGTATTPPGPLPAIPTLVLAGTQDVRTPLENARAIAAATPETAVVPVPGAGHSVLSEEWECVDDAVLRFFADRPVGTPCAGLRGRPFDAPPVPPRALAELTPPPGMGMRGRVGRTARAVQLSLADMRWALSLGGFTGAGALAGNGLHGGRVRATGGLFGLELRLDDYSHVPGVRITGRVDVSLGGSDGRIRVDGPAAADGVLLLRSSGVLEGRLGGARVRFRDGGFGEGLS